MQPLCPQNPQQPPMHNHRRHWSLWCAQLQEPSACPIPGALAVPGSFFVPGQAWGGWGGGAWHAQQPTNANSRWLLRPLPPGARWGSNFPASAPPPLSCCPPVSCHSARHRTGAAAGPPRTEGWGLCGQRGTGCPLGASSEQVEISKHRVSAPLCCGCAHPGLPRLLQGLGVPHSSPQSSPFPLLLPDGFPGWFPRGLDITKISEDCVEVQGGLSKVALGWFGGCRSRSCPCGSLKPGDVWPLCPSEGGTVGSFTGRWRCPG